MAKYDKAAQEKIGEVMHEWIEGKLTQGPKGGKVTSQKQAVAIGIQEARKEGDKVPSNQK